MSCVPSLAGLDSWAKGELANLTQRAGYLLYAETWSKTVTLADNGTDVAFAFGNISKTLTLRVAKGELAPCSAPAALIP